MKSIDLYHPLIIQRNKSPLFYHREEGDIRLAAYNPVCGDEFILQLTMEGQKISKITFHGYGCAVSKAAIDLLIERILGRQIDKAVEEIEYYLSILEMDPSPSLQEYPLSVFQKVKYHPSRKECATLGANSLLSYLKDQLWKKDD